MKRLILGAAGLLLSTSALAGVYVVKSDGAESMEASPSAIALEPKAATGLGKSTVHNAMLVDWSTENAVEAEPASLDIKAMDEPKLIQAQVAEPPPAPSAETMAIEAEANAIEEPVAPVDPMATNYDGLGGPIETADAGAATLDLSPRPAAQNYPACAPGPGDDRCIQLYEPGVQVALASWSGATGGFDNGQTGMGGPEEVIDQSSAIRARDEEAAYEPLPEDVVMPASEDEVAKAESLDDTTLAI